VFVFPLVLEHHGEKIAVSKGSVQFMLYKVF
jgi:hypothetical protein